MAFVSRHNTAPSSVKLTSHVTPTQECAGHSGREAWVTGFAGKVDSFSDGFSQNSAVPVFPG